MFIAAERGVASLQISSLAKIGMRSWSALDFVQNFGDRLGWPRMCGDRPTNADIICACFECLAWRHESFLVARLRPPRTDSLNDYLDFIGEFRAQCFDLMRTGHDSIDSCFHT